MAWNYLFGACDALCVLESCFICFDWMCSSIYLCVVYFALPLHIFLGCVGTLIVNIAICLLLLRNGWPLLMCVYVVLFFFFYGIDYICGTIGCEWCVQFWRQTLNSDKNKTTPCAENLGKFIRKTNTNHSC